MDISRIYNYYPSVDLSNLSGLFSESAFNNGSKICVISYLSRNLRIGETMRFTNKYVLFLENTNTVDSVTWSYRLHNDKDEAFPTDATLLPATVIKNNEYVLEFSNVLLDNHQALRFSRLTVTCVVSKGADSKTIELHHTLVKFIGVETLFTANMEYGSFIGNPDTTNFLVNFLKDYIPGNFITWNGLPVSTAVTGDSSLINYVTALLYYKTVTYLENRINNGSYYDIGRHDNGEIEAFILSDTMGDTIQNTNNGICELPLHLLSDVIDDFTTLPNFVSIDSNNKLYKMLSRPVIAGTNADDTAQNDEESLRLIKESKDRLVAQKAVFDGRKLLDLYHLSRFPKSSIILSGILFKFIFEASRKNTHNECLYKALDWAFPTLDGIKTKSDLINNLYSHYLEGPVNKVTSFRRPARTCGQYAWSPYVYTIANFYPRVTNVYFAKKKVVSTNNQLSCFFIPIDSLHLQQDSAGANIPFDGVLGREVYIIIETIGLENKEVICQVKSEQDVLASGALGLMRNGTQDTEHRATVGSFVDLENNNHSSAHYVNLKKHHADKAIIKLYLRPATRASFNTWYANLTTAGTNNLLPTVKLSDNSEAYWGEDGHGSSGTFLNTAAKGQFRLVGRAFYDIFHSTDLYNYLQGLAGGGAASVIGKVIPTQATDVVYYYRDENDNEHYFGSFTIRYTQRWPITQTQPTDLVTMVEATRLHEYNRDGVHIRFMTDNSPRDYINLDSFAGLLGAMAKDDIADLGFNGFSMPDGSAGASVSHINGVNGDLRYLRTNRDGQACTVRDAQFDYNRQITFTNSLHLYGWGRTNNMLSERFIRNNQTILLPHTTHFHRVTVNNQSFDSADVNPGVDNPQLVLSGPLANTQVNGPVVRHDHHLHLQGFGFNTIVIIL
jgi:hypothetical protein